MEINNDFLNSFEALSLFLRDKYSKIFLILAPPRTASTALARCFWEIPQIRFYSHEPYENCYYEKVSEKQAFRNLINPIDLNSQYKPKDIENSSWLIIKEMPYQVGIDEKFDHLLSLITEPIVVLIRDPRLNIMSRISKRKETKQEIYFPLIETGWEFLNIQIGKMQQAGKDFFIIDSNDFRERTQEIIEKIMKRFGIYLEVSNLLNWIPNPNIELDNLNGRHSHLHRRVLSSNSVIKPSEDMPKIEDFPDYFKNHVLYALSIYKSLRGSRYFIS